MKESIYTYVYKCQIYFLNPAEELHNCISPVHSEESKENQLSMIPVLSMGTPKLTSACRGVLILLMNFGKAGKNAPASFRYSSLLIKA